MISSLQNQVCQTDMEESKLSAKNVHFPAVILDPEFIAKFQEEQRLDQSLKQESYVLLEFMGSKLQFLQ